MDFKRYLQSQWFRGVLVGFGIAILMFTIFQAGIYIGYRKAAFAYRFGDNYYRAFDEGKMFFNMPLKGRDFASVHGAAGRVVSVDLPTFVVAGPDEIEKVVLVKSDTLVRRFDTEMRAADIKVNDFTVVLGSPNDQSQIEAKLIRILPPPPDGGWEAGKRIIINEQTP